jgi:SAM-dependent methyltransferase
MLSPRLKAVRRYLGWADPVHRWRLSAAKCPLCGSSLFLSMRADPFMTRCLRCRATAVNLSIIPLIEKHARAAPLDSVWEMSTYGATLDFLRSRCANVYASEYFPGEAPGAIVDGVRNEDVTRLSFEDNSLDLITSNQVFEHVPEDIIGFAECFRVLRPGGALIMTVPLYKTARTVLMAEIKDGQIVFHQEPEYHDSRTAGPKTALVFWQHSMNDICERVSSVGFEAELVDVEIAPSQKRPYQVIYARKH